MCVCVRVFGWRDETEVSPYGRIREEGDGGERFNRKTNIPSGET